jgi:RNA-directed DNA polymerase
MYDQATENNDSYLLRNSAEHEEQAVVARRSFRSTWKERDSAQPKLLERILSKDNMNSAYKRVKANGGAPGVDGMTVDDALPWLKEHSDELIDRIRRGKYTPRPVRRKEIPKPDGGVRKLGIPTVIDRIVQQAIAQMLVPIFEPLFSPGSFGYRPHRGAKDAIRMVKSYADEGYTQAVVLDLSKYFDTINHEKLLNLVRRSVMDERVVQLIKRFLKSGVMEDGVVIDTTEGSPQGGPLSPLLANIYLNEFDQEFRRRGVPCIRYADDIVLLAKSKRAAQRLLESSIRYLEGKLKLTVNRTKSRAVSVFSAHDFKYLGFALGKGRKGAFIRAHEKSRKKIKDKVRMLTARPRGSIVTMLSKLTTCLRGWINYYGVADMKSFVDELFGWICARIRLLIWLQWKRPRARLRRLRGLGVPEDVAWQTAMTRRGPWWTVHTLGVNLALTKERLVKWGLYDLPAAYQSMHS